MLEKKRSRNEQKRTFPQKTKLFLLLGMMLAANQTTADNGTVNAGSSLTTGPVSNSYSLSAANNNPAMTSLVIGEEEKWRFSFLPNISFGVEVGDMNNFSDELDELIAIIDDPGSVSDSAQEVLDRFNAVLIDMGESGYIKNSLNINAPFFPLFHKSDRIRGSMGLSINAQAQLGLRVLDAPLSFDQQNSTFSTSTSLYIKSGIEKSIAVSYSRPMFEHLSNRWGKIYGGVKLKLIQMELSKQLFTLHELEGKDVDEVIKDEYDANQKSTNNFGIDIGVVWERDRYRAGLTIENINSPEFDYGTVGGDCTHLEEGTTARSNCEVTSSFVQERGDIKGTETYTKHALARIDGLVHITPRWLVMSALDLAKYDDITGFENQWWHVATSYESGSWALPSVRVGYQKNLAGSKTSSAALGFTLFKGFTLDVEYGLETVEVDGTSLPRRLGIAIGIEEQF